MNRTNFETMINDYLNETVEVNPTNEMKEFNEDLTNDVTEFLKYLDSEYNIVDFKLVRTDDGVEINYTTDYKESKLESECTCCNCNKKDESKPERAITDLSLELEDVIQLMGSPEFQNSVTEIVGKCMEAGIRPY